MLGGEQAQRLLRTSSGCLGSRQKGQCVWETGSWREGRKGIKQGP